MNEEVIIDKLLSIFEDIEDVQLLKSHDYTDERQDSVIVVGIESCEKMHPFCPDYRYDVTISVDSFIEPDTSGEKYRSICKAVSDKLDYITQNQHLLPTYFGDVNVVYFVFKNFADAVMDESNRCDYHCELIASF